jgi:transposase InsO family protein
VIGTIRREYQHYYNQVRPHLSLNRNSPVPREADGEEHGERILSEPYLGGLHHRYYRAAA